MVVCFNVLTNAQTTANGRFETAPPVNKSPLVGKSDTVPAQNTIRLRCPATQLPTYPLIILDDCVYNGDLNNIDPNTIESITVLKDSAAIALWGSAATKGVIIITTKKKDKKKKPVSVPIT